MLIPRSLRQSAAENSIMKKLIVVIVTALAVSAAVGSLSAQSAATQGTAAQATPTPQATPSPSPSPAPKPAGPQPKSEIIQKVIVKVNGEIFTQSELEFRQIQALRDQQKTARRQDLTTDPGLIAALQTVTPDLLADAVDELMLVQHGHEMGLKFTDAIFTHMVEQLKQSNKIPDDATFQQALKQEGMTMADLRVNVERNWFINEVQQRELMRNMTLTEEEARQYYNAHPDQFMKPSTVTLREIVVTVPNQTVAGQVSFNVNADEAAKQKIEAIRARALKGEDFVKLVTEASESTTKDSGGIIGPVNTADLSSSLADLLTQMKPGDVTEPMRTRNGYQIIKLDSRSEAVPEPFERSRDQISQRILNSRLDVERAKFLDKLYVQAVIEWKDDGYKKMYEAARAARKATPAKEGK
jgi:peptidyl-prolyl cis-trans isomerase SurA